METTEARAGQPTSPQSPFSGSLADSLAVFSLFRLVRTLPSSVLCFAAYEVYLRAPLDMDAIRAACIHYDLADPILIKALDGDLMGLLDNCGRHALDKGVVENPT